MRARILIYILAAVAILLGMTVIVIGFEPGGPLNTPVPSSTSTGTRTGTRAATRTRTVTLTSTRSRTATLTPTSAFVSVADLVRIPSGAIYDLWVSPQGELWVAAGNGLFRHMSGDAYQRLSDLAFSRILGTDNLGRLWAVDLGGGTILSYGGGSWRVYGLTLGWEPLQPAGLQRQLAVDGRGQLWLATGTDDLRHFDPLAGRWESLHAADLGYAPADPNYQGHYLTVAAIASGGTVWVGDCIGMGEGFDGQGARYLGEQGWLPVEGTDGECVFDIERDIRGRMWLGASDRLLRYDPADGSWVQVPLAPWNNRQIVTSITLDPAGNPWVGLLRCGGAACDTQAFYFLKGTSWIPFLDESTGYDYAPGLGFTADGSAWVCNQGSVYRRSSAGQVTLVGSLQTGLCLVGVEGSNSVWVAASSGPDAGVWQVKP